MIIDISSPSDTIAATQFTQSIMNVNHVDREMLAFDAITGGHVPAHCRAFVDVIFAFQTNTDLDTPMQTMTLHVLPDYLCIGTDDDFMRMPLWPTTAQRIATLWDCMLPTTKLVDIIWNAAANRLSPQPWGPPYDETMQSTERFIAYEERVKKQFATLNVDQSKLTVGHKKDVVITNRLALSPDRVALYGWHQTNGHIIQPLYLGHDFHYSDYSHGIRLISKECFVDDQPDSIERILQDPSMCQVLSSEGVMRVLRQPGS